MIQNQNTDMQNRNTAVRHMNNALTGTFRATDRGFGFITPEDGGDDLFVPARFTGGAWDGDTVSYRTVPPRFGYRDRNKEEARITGVTSRAVTDCVGTLQVCGGSWLVIPDASRRQALFVGKTRDASAGDKVKVHITSYGGYDDREGTARGEIVKVLGKETDPGVDILSIAEDAGISNEFPADVLAEADALPESVSEADTNGRTDFRDWYTVTIDGESTKDFDDAVSIRKDGNGGYALGVHIADVSHYVKEGSALDREALKRGTSTYLPDRTLPMLPVQLSNGICSLNPREDRLTLSAVMLYDKNGKRTGFDITESVICSNERMTYTNVTALLSGTADEEIQARYKEGLPHFEMMRDLYEKLAEKRKARGMISFTIPEPEVVMDTKGHVTDIRPHTQDLAMKMIEQFMLEANEAVAEFFCRKKIPFEYRIHENPDPDRLSAAALALQEIGIAAPWGKDKVTPGQVAEAARAAEGTDAEAGAGLIIVRSMARARYADECKGHFGLAARYYCHFTSPIRRYPDTQIHRIIHEYLDGTLTDERKAHYKQILPVVADMNSRAERTSAKAEMDAVDMKAVEWLSGHIGETFPAVISGVVKRGVFAMLPNTAEGLIPMEEFGDGFVSDDNGWSATDEESGRMVSIGQLVRVRVVSADKRKRQAEFALVGKPKRPKEKPVQNG